MHDLEGRDKWIHALRPIETADEGEGERLRGRSATRGEELSVDSVRQDLARHAIGQERRKPCGKLATYEEYVPRVAQSQSQVRSIPRQQIRCSPVGRQREDAPVLGDHVRHPPALLKNVSCIAAPLAAVSVHDIGPPP